MKSSNSRIASFLDFWGPIIFSILLYLGIRDLVAEARYIPSGSMLPTLKINDRLLIEKITLPFRTIKRGDIVVFNSPYAFDHILSAGRNTPKYKCMIINFPLINLISGLSYPACDAYIKRVVAIGGDKVSIDKRGQVFINGIIRNEPYISNYCIPKYERIRDCGLIDKTVPTGSLLVLGDNRDNSWDSRFWPGGPFLPESEIIGRAVWRFWPLNRFGKINP
tara:strand:+ start:4583 stop:5245 length:663 start_codon:yes stop_codon:yes gene_type:complete